MKYDKKAKSRATRPGRGKKAVDEGIKIRGFFRLKIVSPDGTVTGDTGWRENTITNQGFKLFLADNIGKSAGSLQISHAGLGTGTAPDATATDLPNEISGSTRRQAVTYANVASKTARFTGTFASSDTFLDAASTIKNIGLFNSSSSGTCFAGNTYATSSCDTNQNVNFTYDIIFA